jgi:predicted NUDIX family NTP pyrophosphohydrolase
MPKLSAGILPYRVADDGSLSVLLVHPGGPFWKNKDEHAWSIPKGEYGPDENPEAAAAREFAEELGLPVPEGPWLDLGTIRQSGGKLVRAWTVRSEELPLDRMVSNRFEMEWPPRSGQMQDFPEVDRAEWMSLPQASVRLVKGQVEFLARLRSKIPPAP